MNKMMVNTLKRSSALNKRKVRLLLDHELRNKYVADQIKIGLRNQLRALRDERGITQTQLAEMIGTKQSVISRIERDPVRVGMPVYMDIAEKLDVAFVARFEAIDTVVEWYDNPSVKKMTPRKSSEILRERARELLSPAFVPSEVISAETISSNGTPLSPSYRTDPDVRDGFYNPINGRSGPDVQWLPNADVIEGPWRPYEPMSQTVPADSSSV